MLSLLCALGQTFAVPIINSKYFKYTIFLYVYVDFDETKMTLKIDFKKI